MSNSKITALEIESLAQSIEAPEPIPLPLSVGVPVNPMAMPVDWSAGVGLRTRWLTDVTRPFNSNRTERVSLTSRPTRTVSVSLLGMDRDEASTMLQAAMAHAGMRGVPVPLYCDPVTVELASGPAIKGDFRWKRFFRGGRVVVMKGVATTVKASNDVFFATVLSVALDQMVLDAVPRAVVPGDIVLPCIDVECLDEASGISQVDTIWSVNMEWVEVEGASTLPALWPSACGDGSVLEPICQVVDGYAVFPFDPNWAKGVGVDILRMKDTDGSGRGSIEAPEGLPYHRFTLDLMGYDRSRSWNILRFFDAMRGRAGSFWFIHPLRPLRPWTTLVPVGGLTQAYLQPIGDIESLRRYVRRLAFFRADGSFVIRSLTDASDSGSRFTVLLDSALPDTNFVDVQPIHRCNFSSDEIEETWNTDTVIPSISLAIEENPNPGDVSSGSIIALQHALQFPAFQSIDNLNLIVRAGCGNFQEDGKPCTAWPGPAAIDTWVDISDGPRRQPSQERVRRYFLADAACTLIKFQGPWENNKQHAILEPSFTYATQLDAETPRSQRPLWSADGWTMCMCFSPERPLQPTQGDRFLVRIEEAAGMRFALLNDSAVGRGWTNRSGVIVARSNGTLVSAGLTADYRVHRSAVFITVRVDSSAVRVWVNGQQALSAPLALTGGIYTATSDYTVSSWFSGLLHGTAVSAANIRESFEKLGCANMIVSYARPLDVTELNTLHTLVSDMFRTSNASSTIY